MARGNHLVHQQSIRYRGGYVQELYIDVFEHLKVVDYGDVKIFPEFSYESTLESILEAQALVETSVRQVIAAGAILVVIWQNSPVASYTVGRLVAEYYKVKIDMVKPGYALGLLAIRLSDDE